MYSLLLGNVFGELSLHFVSELKKFRPSRYLYSPPELHLFLQFLRRAISSSSLDGVCAVINNACSLMEADYCSVLRAQLRLGYMSGYLDLTQAYNALQSSLQQGRLQASDSEKARLKFLVRGQHISSINYTLLFNMNVHLFFAFGRHTLIMLM